MKKNVLFLFLLFIFQIAGCKQNEIKKNNEIKESIENKPTTSINFLSFLDEICWEGHKGVFKNCDELFTDKGHMFFIIIPKGGAENSYNKQMNNFSVKDVWKKEDKILEQINKCLVSNLEKDFNIWVFYVDVKFLKRNPDMDSPYSPVNPRKVQVCFYKEKLKRWDVIDVIDINNEKDESNFNNWRENYINSIVKKSNESSNNSSEDKIKISQKWQGKFSRNFTEKFNDGSNSSWVYYFIIESNKVVFKSDSELPIESEYKGLERNNQLELFEGDNKQPSYIIKEDGGKFYIQSDSFENRKGWLLLDKN
ncbi:hypothetical protein [Flavobacterium johnsoniae]|uniref:hypothetical protein n=1 Tax=Flavobacterium johnsoniae TaxID=986 RepID=UPI0011EEF2F6|nr:hypothetical protein [Flavobacterium johnsoniae]